MWDVRGAGHGNVFHESDQGVVELNMIEVRELMMGKKRIDALQTSQSCECQVQGFWISSSGVPADVVMKFFQVRGRDSGESRIYECQMYAKGSARLISQSERRKIRELRHVSYGRHQSPVISTKGARTLLEVINLYIQVLERGTINGLTQSSPCSG